MTWTPRPLLCTKYIGLDHTSIYFTFWNELHNEHRCFSVIWWLYRHFSDRFKSKLTSMSFFISSKNWGSFNCENWKKLVYTCNDLKVRNLFYNYQYSNIKGTYLYYIKALNLKFEWQFYYEKQSWRLKTILIPTDNIGS